jgi:L-idonate 5-dehydrogenase
MTATQPVSRDGAGTIRALVAHGPADLRIDRRPVLAPGPGQIVVRVRYGGVCGSDLHYWRHGRVGDYQLREPLTLGHEVVGTVQALGAEVTGPEPGTPVFVHPATTCGRCPACRAGRPNVCTDVRYLGSAARTPHVQGGFADLLSVPAAQVLALPAGLDLRTAAVVEPASVAWHAVGRAGPLAGARVLVTGAGPIGALVVATARRAGAAEIVVTDLARPALDRALTLGADSGVLVGSAGPVVGQHDDLGRLDADVAIESSGSAAGLATCLRAVRRGGRLVTLGLLPSGEVPAAVNLITTRELEVVGAFRFHDEPAAVMAALADGSLDAGPVVTHVLPLSGAAAASGAFELAADPARSGKVLIDFAVRSGPEDHRDQSTHPGRPTGVRAGEEGEAA